jgi:hypothetical protein
LALGWAIVVLFALVTASWAVDALAEPQPWGHRVLRLAVTVVLAGLTVSAWRDRRAPRRLVPDLPTRWPAGRGRVRAAVGVLAGLAAAFAAMVVYTVVLDGGTLRDAAVELGQLAVSSAVALALWWAVVVVRRRRRADRRS